MMMPRPTTDLSLQESRAFASIRNNVVADNPQRNDEPLGTPSTRNPSKTCPARQSPSAMPSTVPQTAVAKPPPSPAAPATPTPTSSSPPPTTGIYKLNTTLSHVYTHVHTPFLLSSVFFSLPALIANPLPSLTYGAAAVALIQSAYCAICLQPTLGGTATKKKKKKTKAGPPGVQAKKEEDNEWVGPAIDIAYVCSLSPQMLKVHTLTALLTAPRILSHTHDPLHIPGIHSRHPPRRTTDHASPTHDPPNTAHRLPRPLPALLRPPSLIQTLA